MKNFNNKGGRMMEGLTSSSKKAIWDAEMCIGTDSFESCFAGNAVCNAETKVEFE